jgi:hypothetical protein
VANFPNETQRVSPRAPAIDNYTFHEHSDLAVLSQDIFRVPLEDLPKTESVLTMVGGCIAYAGGRFARYRNGFSSDLRK